ncbi:transposase [Bradyrhizobium sp. 195]|nr:transposase [Bradyrhizobium sp. 195]
MPSGRRAGADFTPRFLTAAGRPWTLLAALRHDRIDAPRFIEGPFDGGSFRTYVEKILLPILRLDKLGSHRSKAVRQLIRSVGAKLLFLPKILARLEPDRTGFAKLKHLLRKAAARTVSAPQSAMHSMPSPPRSAPTTSKIRLSNLMPARSRAPTRRRHRRLCRA